jgi:hypothetical protein
VVGTGKGAWQTVLRAVKDLTAFKEAYLRELRGRRNEPKRRDYEWTWRRLIQPHVGQMPRWSSRDGSTSNAKRARPVVLGFASHCVFIALRRRLGVILAERGFPDRPDLISDPRLPSPE